MKHIFLMILLLAVLFGAPAEKTSDAVLPDMDAEIVDTALPEVVDIFSDVYITEEKLEAVSSSGQKYVWQGTVLQDDEGMSPKSVGPLLQAQLQNGQPCPMPGEILLHFAEEIPESIKVYDHFYMDENMDGFVYSNLQKCYSIEPVNSTETLDIGMNFASSLSSDFTAKYYRVLRLVCVFDRQTVEYYVFVQ